MQKIKSFTRRHGELWKFVKFNFTVIVTSALDIGLYMLLLYTVFRPLNSNPLPDNALLSFLGIRYEGYLYSYLISTTAGYVAAYLMNRRLTFHSNVNPAYSGTLYFLLSAFNILLSSWLGSAAGALMLEHGFSSAGAQMLAKFIIINIPTLWTYPLERYLIQIKSKRKIKVKEAKQ